MMNYRKKGSQGEDFAAEYLRKKGLRIIDRNFRFRRGEIDIIAEDGGVLVFVEVKARWSHSYGDPEDAVSASKCRQIERVAQGFVGLHRLDDRPYRFDVVAVEYEGEKQVIRHIENAF